MRRILIIALLLGLCCSVNADRYNGSTLDETYPYYYNGSSLVPTTRYRYNGATLDAVSCVYEATETSCSDGCDNDRDGLTDGADTADCGGAVDYTQDANIISWWPLGEASGDRYDGSANNNDLSDGATVTQATGPFGSTFAAQFTAANYEYLYRSDADLAPAGFPGKATTGGTGAFSIGGWVYLDDTGTERYLVSKGDTAPENMSYRIYYNGTNVVFEVSTIGWDVSASITGGTTLSDGTWYHVVGIYTGSYLQLFLGTIGGSSSQDATQVAFTDPIFLDDGDFVLGAKRANGNTPHNGRLFEFFVFADGLSGSEVEEIRSNGLEGDR